MDSLFYNKIRKYGFWLLAVVLLTWQVYNGFIIEYPPSSEQILLSNNNLLAIRIASLGMVLAGIYFMGRLVKKTFVLVILSSPLTMGMWLTRPLESFKFCLVMIGVYITVKRKNMSLGFGLLIIFIITFGYFQNSDKASIYNLFSSRELGRQTEEKFLREDDLVNQVKLPLWFRRVAYNKVTMFVRGLFKESISFWNLEDYFYQEFPPNSKKSLVMFFWPLVIPFGVGIYVISKNRKQTLTAIVKILLIMAFINFLFSSSKENYRLILAFPLIAVVIAVGIERLKEIRWIYITVIVLWFYGWQMFGYDFRKRPDFWLDNRPLVYKALYKNLTNIDDNLLVNVTDLMGDARRYCVYFLQNRCNKNFKYGSFNLKINDPVVGQVYAGFEGEFLGPDFNNKFPENSESEIISKGFYKIASDKIRDSIAYKYGELIFVGVKQ